MNIRIFGHMKRFAAAFIFALAAFLPLAGQNNPYEIDDECYKYFQEAENAVTDVTSDAFEKANKKLLEAAAEKGDEKARTLYYVEELKRASRMGQYIEKNGYSALRNTDRCVQLAAQSAARMGMHPYYLYRQKNMTGNLENVGYAREGKEGLYNILIMEEIQTILALGAGSITKGVFPNGRIERSDNCKDVETYIRNIEEMIGRKEKLFGYGSSKEEKEKPGNCGVTREGEDHP